MDVFPSNCGMTVCGLEGIPGPPSVERTYGNQTAAETRSFTPDFVQLLSHTTLGDAGAGTYALETAEPAHSLKINIGSQWFGYRSRTITPEICEADPTGATASDAAFERLADYANQLIAGSDVPGRGLLINATGNYQLNEQHIFGHSQLTFDFQGRGLLNTSAASLTDTHAALYFTRSDGLGVKTTMTADAARNGKTITVASTVGFFAGLALMITSTGEYWNGISDPDHNSGYATSYKGELNSIESVAGNVITLALPLKDYYLAETYTTYVRVLNLLDDITIKNMRAVGTGGGTNHTSGNPTGPRAIRGDFCRRLTFDTCYLENHPRFAIETYLGFDQKMIGSTVIGRKLDDPSNLPNISEWFTGWLPGGVLGIEVIGSNARYARRLVDPDASLYRMIDNDPNQQVPSREIVITGGLSEVCVTGPAGHKYQGMTINGHRTRRCRIGVQHRGIDLVMNGCDIDATFYGLVLGVGSSQSIDPTTYSDDPTCGSVYVTGGRIVSDSRGIFATQSWEDMNLSALLIDAPKPIYFSGKRQANLRVSNVKLLGGGSDPAILSDYVGKDTLANWRITDSQVNGADFAIDLLGTDKSEAHDLIFERIKFTGVTDRYFRFGKEGVPLWGDRLIVKNCISDGGAVAGVSDSFGSEVLEIGNDWTPNVRTAILAGGVLTIPDNIPLGYPYYLRVDAETHLSAPTDPDEATTVAGGAVGTVIVLTSASSNRDITIKNGTGNINCGADFVLTNSLDTITVMKVQADAWAAISKLDNAA